MITSLITIGSQTNAIKAQKFLKNYGIASETVKTEGKTGRGCIYAVKVRSEDYEQIKRLLINGGLIKEER